MSELSQNNRDKQFMIECLTDSVIQLLIEEYGWSIPTALEKLYTSNTYHKLEDERTGLYYQGAVYLFDILRQEINKQNTNVINQRL